jgi:hypothetical protein
MSLHRARRKRGLRYVGIEVRNTEVSELVRRGLVTEQDCNDCTAIRDAIYRFFDTHLSTRHGAAQ